MKIKGSYFVDEDYSFEEEKDNLPVFVEMLKNRGCYIAEDWHIRSKKGGMMSKLMRNGYWMTVAQYNRKCYYFMEHRVIWCWLKGAIPNGLVVNHKDYNKANNNIDNLELMTQKENSEYSRPNYKPCKGEKGRNAAFANKQVASLRFVMDKLGWSSQEVADFTNEAIHNIRRIRRGERYCDVEAFDSILEAYPILVDYTRNKKIGIVEEMKNYSMGLCGEVGELVDMLKKHLYHGKPLDRVEVMLELGDILYYCVVMMLVLGEPIDLVMLNNNAKLLARYKDGFSEKASNERVEDSDKKIQ